MSSDLKKLENLKHLAMNSYEKRKFLFTNEKYLLWKIKKNWEKIVGKPIAERSEPKNLFQGVLQINTNDSTFHHMINTYSNVIKEKANKLLEREAVREIDLRQINYKIYRGLLDELIENDEIRGDVPVNQIPKRRKKKEFEENLKKLEKVKWEEIELTDKELQSIYESLDKIDKKYAEHAQRLEGIAINRRKKDKYLLANGYSRCEECGKIFLPHGDEKICYECYGKKEEKKLQKMVRLIQQNPFIGEKKAIQLTDTDVSTYYRVRDKLAQEIYEDMLYFCLEKDMEIKYNSDYSYEIKAEARKSLISFMKNYIYYKIGSDDRDVLEIEQKKVLKKLNRDLNFRRKK